MTNSVLKTELAIIQAPMAGVQNAKLVVAVCEAGGLGSLPCAMLSAELLKSELDYLSQHTDKPYNLNFFCHQTPDYTLAQQTAWHNLLTPYFDEFAVDVSQFTRNASRQPINQQIIDIIAPYTPAVVSFHFGLPSREIVSQIKAWGGTVLSSATTLDEARWLQTNGADAVIAQGIEAGGHRGHFLSMDLSLQPTTAQLVRESVELDIPVIAAGGICTAEDVAQYQALGVAAVQVGSAYLLCEEATTSALHREVLKTVAPDSTELTTLFSGRPARGISNRVMQELGAMPEQAPPFPYASIAMTALRAKAEAKGDSGFSPLWCGERFIVREGINAQQITELLMQGWQS
ncbi:MULTISPECIES: nitronate monooxygenase [unclassified Pseudoalteromonas]|uniref:NAD(P)H-dependent flavin oxidoreductase n=1 Tax=unclassified Pseudoalteromonas TaxID=194690 RepID=UPI00110BFED4|nr:MULTISPECIES: nitronate monooxygenase [unclassified Pseudoalteromonas]TMP48412.1 2-nitropropane dioxygenase [Pseudoalteromonas sp. S1650]TMP66522.1 2-nitropropane dioxygenase [Pseudoalteromonas sp. S1649]